MEASLPTQREEALQLFKIAHRRTVCTRGVPFVNVLDVGGKYACLHVCTSRSEQDIVRMPVDREHGGADRLLELLRHPPVVVRIKGTNRDRPGRLGNDVITGVFKNDDSAPHTHLAPLATANLSSKGLQRTKVAARLMRSKTSVGFQTGRPVSGSGACCHT